MQFYKTYQVVSGWLKNFVLYGHYDDFLKDTKHYVYSQSIAEELALQGPYKKMNYWREKDNKGKEVEGIDLDSIPAFEWNAPVMLEFDFNTKRIGINMIGSFTATVMEENAFRPMVSLGIQERDLVDVEYAKKGLKYKDLF